LLPVLRSGSVAVTDAVLAYDPVAAALATTVMVALAPPASVPSGQLIGADPEQLPWLGVAETKTRPAARVSVRATLVAAVGLLFPAYLAYALLTLGLAFRSQVQKERSVVGSKQRFAREVSGQRLRISDRMTAREHEFHGFGPSRCLRPSEPILVNKSLPAPVAGTIDHVTGPPVAVNCCVPPRFTDAVAGETVTVIGYASRRPA
jgi:hypothetical protein